MKKQKLTTHQINEKAHKLLEKHPDGVRWTDLNKMVTESDLSFHPKTINGCIWKLVENSPTKYTSRKKVCFGW